MQILDNIHAFFWQSMTANNCNTYLIDGPTRILIDPGHISHFDHVRQELAKMNLGIEDLGLVLCTHAHPDHVEATQLFKQISVPVAIHEAEWPLIQAMESQIAAMGLSLDAIAPDFFLKAGDLNVQGLDLKVYHTPGHSPGSVCFYRPELKALFTGDLVFKAGLGRTDLPGGDGERIKKSILQMADLDVELILPGHGDVVSGAGDVKQNFAQLEQFYFGYI